MDWSACPLISIDADVMHGEPVFKGTRMPVEDAIESYYAYRELQEMSDEDAIKATLESFPTIPGPEGLRTVLAYEAAHEHQLQP
ncbi:MAG: DUF433 domain-containing protein [Acidobacteriaceae bacterium]|nr:DUF433 domain-containing protein [Acidobacteriaceae bacterium]